MSMFSLGLGQVKVPLVRSSFEDSNHDNIPESLKLQLERGREILGRAEGLKNVHGYSFWSGFGCSLVKRVAIF